MNRSAFDPAAIEAAWTAFQREAGGVASIGSQRDYERVVALMNGLLDVVRGNERHPLASLLGVLGDLVAAYEAREVAMPDVEPREVLRLLMETNTLSQADLAEELGGQSVVSNILAGKRAINARQARALSERFGVSSAVFIG
jgi:HTH-type transcriptional regulator / antitoxin HigA